MYGKVKDSENIVKTKADYENSYPTGNQPRKNKDSQKSPQTYETRQHFQKTIKPPFSFIFNIRRF